MCFLPTIVLTPNQMPKNQRIKQNKTHFILFLFNIQQNANGLNAGLQLAWVQHLLQLHGLHNIASYFHFALHEGL